MIAFICAHINNLDDSPRNVIMRLPDSTPCGLVTVPDVRNLIDELIDEILRQEELMGLIESNRKLKELTETTEEDQDSELKKTLRIEAEKWTTDIEKKLKDRDIVKRVKLAMDAEKKRNIIKVRSNDPDQEM